MQWKNFSSVSVAIFFIFAVIGHASQGGGFKIQDQSARAMGMIDAFVAGADDASAVYYNPAGLTRLTSPQLIANFYLAHAEITHDGPGGRERSDSRIYAIPNFYLGLPLSDTGRWTAGLGVYSPFGLGSKWGDDSLVRYYTTLAEIELVNVNPTLAWQLQDDLSLGAGINYYYSRVKMRHKIDNPFGVGDGEFKLEGSGDGWGYNLGLQYQLLPEVALGLTYRSAVDVTYDGDLQLKHIVVPGPFPPGYAIVNLYSDIRGDIEFPAVAAGGLMWQARPDLRLEFAAELQQWSSRSKQQFQIFGDSQYLPAGTETQQLNWRDSWVLMLGAEYDLTDRWALRGGYAYNESPVPAETADPSLPPGDTHAASLGLGYRISPAVRLDVAGVVSYQEKAMIKSEYAPPGSEYKSWGGYFALGVTWEF